MSVKQIKPLYPDAGMPLQFGSPQYVERSADEHLARVLETGHSAFLFGPRRIGKTSLLIREAYKARLRGMAMAFVDFQAYGIYDDKWLDYLGLDISQQVGRDWSQWKDDGLFGIQSMLREVANDHEDNGVFLAFDECDSLNRLGNARPFATMIRSTLNPLFGNVRCVCAGLVPPWLWHDDDELGSPWWNLMFPIRLTNFNIEQVRHLWQAADLPDQEMVPILHQVTGGQPTMIAYAAIETRRAGELQAVLDSAFSRKGNFMFIAKTLLRSANYLLGERADQICQEVLAAQPISGHERECLWLSGVILDPDDHPPLIAGDVMRRILETLAKGERA